MRSAKQAGFIGIVADRNQIDLDLVGFQDDRGAADRKLTLVVAPAGSVTRVGRFIALRSRSPAYSQPAAKTFSAPKLTANAARPTRMIDLEASLSVSEKYI